MLSIKRNVILVHTEELNVIFRRVTIPLFLPFDTKEVRGVRWPGGRASDSKSRGPGFDSHTGHRVVSLNKIH